MNLFVSFLKRQLSLTLCGNCMKNEAIKITKSTSDYFVGVYLCMYTHIMEEAA